MDLQNIIDQSIKNCIAKSVQGVLSYSNESFRKAVQSEVEDRMPVIRKIISESLDELFDKDIQLYLKEEFKRKVAKSMVGMLTGSIDKACSKLKSDPVIKSRMIIAIQDVMEMSEPTTDIVETKNK